MSDIGLYSIDADGLVVFSLKNMDRVVTGPEEALQIVAYHLFTSPGTNKYNRDEGGGLLSLLDNNLKSVDELNADASIIVSRAMSSVLSAQSQDKPANATVSELRLQSVDLLESGQEIRVTIVISLRDGNSFQTTFRVT